MKKLMFLAAAILLVGGLASAPASAATAKKASHARSCYNYAWDSQAQKDCLAGKAAKPAVAKKASKKSVKKAAAKKKKA